MNKKIVNMLKDNVQLYTFMDEIVKKNLRLLSKLRI